MYYAYIMILIIQDTLTDGCDTDVHRFLFSLLWIGKHFFCQHRIMAIDIISEIE